MRYKAIAFDFDGVILESADIKTRAMVELFSGHGEHVDDIVALHKRLEGISRYVKFDMIYRDILKQPLSPAARAKLGQRFSAIVLEQVLSCPFVPGAREFLDTNSASMPLFVVSGTPDTELSHIVSERGLGSYFQGVHGSDRGKPEILNTILSERGWRADDIVFVGDGLSDYEAAIATSIAFIGRVREGADCPFPADTMVVRDLTEMEHVLDQRKILT